MRIALLLVAVVAAGLGLWLIASGFIEPAQDSAATTQMAATPKQNINPFGPGIALLAGSVFFLFLILRRR